MNNNKLNCKDEFASVLEQAMGNRSITECARISGVSASYISKILRKNTKSSPTPEIIGKLATIATNGITYNDLMAAAGHILLNQTVEVAKGDDDINNNQNAVDNLSPKSPHEKLAEEHEITSKYTQAILSHLYDVKYPWQIKKPDLSKRMVDMEVDVKDGKYTKWLLDFKVIQHNPKLNIAYVEQIYGHYTLQKIEYTEKITLVVNNDKVYKQFLNKKPISLKANLYIMLIDVKKNKVVKEDQIGFY